MMVTHCLSQPKADLLRERKYYRKDELKLLVLTRRPISICLGHSKDIYPRIANKCYRTRVRESGGNGASSKRLFMFSCTDKCINLDGDCY